MSRIIKFRGLTIENVWVHGDLLNEFNNCPFKRIVNRKGGDNPVIINTIGQFTFCKDINDKEIYEGDILSKLWRVEVFQNHYGTFMVKFHENPKGNRPQTLKEYLFKRERAGTKDRDNIIIGNIYETPELLQS